MMVRWAVVASVSLGLFGCSGEEYADKAGEKAVSKSETSARNYKDATEIPNVTVIKPKLDPKMVYDFDLKRTIDKNSGEYFASTQINPINRIYQASIRDQKGKVLMGYEYRYGGSRLPNGEEKSVYEIIWSVRGEDIVGKMMNEQVAARELRKNDSLDRLAAFMLAQSIGHYGGINKGETVLVDRRMDDLQGEMQ